MQPLLDEVGVPRTADQGPEFPQEDTNETPADLMAMVKVRAFFSAISV